MSTVVLCYEGADGVPIAVSAATPLPLSDAGAVQATEVGQPNGVASLDGSGKIPTSQMPVGDVTYKGTWDAATNTPTLAAGVGVEGDLYICSVAGTQSIGGSSVDYGVGDWVIYDGALWDQVTGHGPAPANPSVTVGLTAKNGTAPTFMRSDGAPALDQTIAPTWTGLHKFGAGANVGGAFGVAADTNPPSPTNSGIAVGTSPNWAMLSFYEQANTANNRTFDLLWITNGIKFRFANDARSAFLDVLTINGGQVLGVTGITSTSGSGAWTHTGAYKATGDVSAGDGMAASMSMIGGTSGQASTLQAYGATPDVSMRIATKGDGLLALRSGATDRLSITPTDLAAGAGYVPANALSLATKAYVDAHAPGVVVADGKTAQTANVNVPALYAVPTTGMYRVSAFVALSQAATTSSTLPSVGVNYTEAITSTVVQDNNITAQSTLNQVGVHSGGSAVILAQQGSNIGYVTSGYASSGATAMHYGVQIKVEFLG
jgi:hypothetical protein